MGTLIVLLGPTGVGKTEICLRLADSFNIPVINADSRQIYREIPIGTAAPTEEQRARAFHYFVGTHNLEDYYSASIYEQEALSVILREIKEKGVALMSGGSMMYIDAVCNGIDDIPTVDNETRLWMKERLQKEGLQALTEELKILDPQHYAIVDLHNPRRVVHALEICHMTGQTYTSFRKGIQQQRPFKILKVGLNRERDELYHRINQRVLQMMEQGLQEEARAVYPKRQLNSLNTVGYRELFSYFDGEIPLDEAVRQIQSNSRQYMRKQLTWFKRDKDINWFHPNNDEGIINYIKKSL